MMPTVGDLQIVPGSLQNPDGGYRSRFKHANEKATAGYYSVVLKDYNIKVELSALTYTGFHRYTFPASDNANILIDLGRAHKSTSETSFQIIDNRHIQGTQRIIAGPVGVNSTGCQQQMIGSDKSVFQGTEFNILLERSYYHEKNFGISCFVGACSYRFAWMFLSDSS